ncbi:MAG TPA: hypothetical protein VHC39_13065 [Rhizomicrobium sp.]|nr:hypothetical protein [Rhizomicrobium sp.]
MANKPAAPPSRAALAMSASEQRDRLIKEMLEKERAATDAKIERLKKLRLARDAELAAQPKPEPKRKR